MEDVRREASRPKISGPRVLLIDDDPAYGRTLNRILRDHLPPIDRIDGIAALERRLDAGDLAYDVILLDIHLRGCSAVQVLELLNRRRCPIGTIVLSAGASDDIVDTCLGLGALRFYSKVFDRKDMMIEIARAAAVTQHRRMIFGEPPVPVGEIPAPKLTRLRGEGRLIHQKRSLWQAALRIMVSDALTKADGNVHIAARIVGDHPQNLWRAMRDLEIDPNTFRTSPRVVDDDDVG